MNPIFYILAAASAVFLLVMAVAYYCYRTAFLVTQKQRDSVKEFDIPDGDIYEPYRDQMVQWIKEVRVMPREDFTVTSFDGITLHARYFECDPTAPTELMFHGYRGNADRDLCGGVQRCLALHHNAFVVDQRGSGKSGGDVISFGVNERRDCETWVKFMIEHFGPDVKIILTGISMGGATVLMASGYPQPENVIGVLSDCGYTSAEEIIKKVIRTDMKLPERLAYPFVKLAARVYGGFDLEELPPIEAVKRTKLPVIIFHGDTDAFVPCEMSERLYEACASERKQLVVVHGAGHGLSYLVEPEMYLSELGAFFDGEGARRYKNV